MRNLMRSLIARLQGRPTHPAPALTYRPKPAPLSPHPPVPRPESPLDGDATALVRPYLLTYEYEEAQRERVFLREMAVAS
ncbi:hypothetical protein ACTPOK_20875 [Streptomyces inhibens]|uniref:hypothetical protein n=1 Tax=Streptomyces inhibens TaxID=2293571 RepID=UPI00402AAB66